MSTTEIRTASGSVYRMSDGTISRLSETPCVNTDGGNDPRVIFAAEVVEVLRAEVGSGLVLRIDLGDGAELLRSTTVVSIEEVEV